MRVVVALGGNALLRRGEPMTAANQRRNAVLAARALVDVAREHELIITHGNGPQVGLLALQSLAYTDVDPYPLDVLGAESGGMIGYMIEQELDTLLNHQKPCVTLLTQVEVDSNDPAFKDPTKFIGPVYSKEEAERLAQARGWHIKPDGDKWRRVVPSPLPKRIFDTKVVELLLVNGVVVICGGGGGIPITFAPDGELIGVEAVIDKDRAGALLAEEVHADAYLILTDTDAIYEGWGTPRQRAMKHCSPEALLAYTFPAGSMGPKVEAACAFAANTGKRAVIGSLDKALAVLNDESGTVISQEFEGISYYE
ncbi:MAG: carbamate kinase [Chloroflexales bacterium]|nr:carbamate kinase [Chloroflexales bacterium]